MIEIRPMTELDLARLALQQEQRDYLNTEGAFELRSFDDRRALVDAGPAWTVKSGDRVLCCAGFQPEPWEGQATAWALLAENIGGQMLAITRAVSHAFDAAAYYRVSAMVRADHVAGARWCRLLGMEHEGTLRAWGPNAIDTMLFAKVYR